MGLEEETENRCNLVEAYLHLPKEVLTALAQSGGQDWPMCKNHCCQRIILDTICGDVWYAHLDRPAYNGLTHNQAKRAVDLCRKIAKGRVELQQLNNQSLIWRGRRPKVWIAFEAISRCRGERR